MYIPSNGKHISRPINIQRPPFPTRHPASTQNKDNPSSQNYQHFLRPPKMKLPILALLAALSLTASATPIADPDSTTLEARDVCGNGFPAYTRRIGTKCTKSDDGREYCSCDREKIVSFTCPLGFVGLAIADEMVPRRWFAGRASGKARRIVSLMGRSVLGTRMGCLLCVLEVLGDGCRGKGSLALVVSTS